MLKPSGVASPQQQAAFTLIELVIGIVILAIALTIITGVLGPLYQRSTDPWHQVRAAELGQSFMNEIMARSFDENSDKAGGDYRCGATPSIEPGATSCTVMPNIAEPIACKDQVAQGRMCSGGSCWGPELNETARDDYDDVDDFHGFVGTGLSLLNILGTSLQDEYLNYKVCIDVRYAGDELTGNTTDINTAKKITVSVVVPSGQQIDFSAYRSNW
ncbi:type IV pilus modification PilV family protein [Rheinheimera soli]|uniref:type IV pilus modification PilV family protein n=1 Tax=Rheinheimera soli TaxID=443616 RepID=UPI001E47F013|nr:prepilin-type N-terminal cleavage/methylation domain-containing protein [Rheinheimera soli]